MFWNPSIECLDRDKLRNLQDARLREMVSYVYDNTPFYRRKLDEAGVSPGDIRGVGDICKLPFTTKTDLRDNYPYGLCAVPMSRIVRIHGSSGTTGRPTVVLFTKNDIALWTECLSRAFTAFGADSNDIFHIAYGYGLFTGGLGMHYGAENVGASVIPMSSGNTVKQIQLMHDFGATALCCTPSYALYLADSIRESGLPPEEFKLRLGAFGAEPWTEAMRLELESKLGIKAFDIYGLSEMSGPGVGYECMFQCGTHINEDHFYPEIVDPETLEPLPEGRVGELVFTHLTKEGMPLLRYRTKDLTALHYEPCDCGRTFVRMDRILGRSDDMLIIRGVNVFPSQIESVLIKLGYTPNFRILVDRVNNLDTFEIQVELNDDNFDDSITELSRQEKNITDAMVSLLGIRPKIKLVNPRSIERTEGKSVRVVDMRKLHG